MRLLLGHLIVALKPASENKLTTIFKEVQRFNQRWLWIMLILTLLVLIGMFGYGFIQQLVLGNPWGDRPMSDTELILVGSTTTLFSGGMIYLFYTLRLITVVSEKGLSIRFYPFRSTMIPYHSITSCQVRTYKPLAEYGGWGIKYGRSGWAYNIRGNRGVQLVLHNGKRILVGSQQAAGLEKAIKHYCRC